jgi:hypothetical protein
MFVQVINKILPYNVYTQRVDDIRSVIQLNLEFHATEPPYRSTLICNALAYLEHYNPEFFQLENVVGLLNFRLRARQEGRCIVGGIQSGVVKFICRTLTVLGYDTAV